MCLYSQLLITSMPPREHPALSQLAHAGGDYCQFCAPTAEGFTAESVKTFFQARPLQAQVGGEATWSLRRLMFLPQMLSAVVLSVLADLVAQMISRRRERARGMEDAARRAG
mmetsp:Transcript_28709/g.92630  ORF Transcript_28709/g.92630 Transcript_28709/m.92630 type:complete len:112 (-) Transcript_28709:1360-1695(-)